MIRSVLERSNPIQSEMIPTEVPTNPFESTPYSTTRIRRETQIRDPRVSASIVHDRRGAYRLDVHGRIPLDEEYWVRFPYLSEYPLRYPEAWQS